MLDDCEDAKSDRRQRDEWGRGIPGFACEGEARGKTMAIRILTHNCCKAFGKEDPSSGVAPVLGVAWRSLSLGA